MSSDPKRPTKKGKGSAERLVKAGAVAAGKPGYDREPRTEKTVGKKGQKSALEKGRLSED